MQCVGRERRLHRNFRYAPGTGVVMSAGVYLREIGKILVFRGAEESAGVKRKMPRPLVGVASGKTRTVRFGFCARRPEREIRFAAGEGRSDGAVK